MKARTTKKNNSASKKLIPAAGALAISAAMLGTSTYAWFTMSREVEVTNISMAATVPEDIQISLGQIGTINNGTITKSTKETDASLANGKGSLVNTNGVVTAPTDDWDWSNIADVSEYYQFGRLIPASSTDGTNIYFTPDADGVGKTVKTGARFYAAALGGAAQVQTAASGDNPATYYNTTAHIVNAKSDGYVTDTWKDGGNNGYTNSAGWDDTQDDGYYVDIPVWLRTSSKDGAALSVKAYVKPRSSTNNNTDGEALYRALRVSILEVGDDNGTATYTNKTDLIPIADGCEKTAAGEAVGALRSDPFALSVASGATTTSYDILDWYTRTADEEAVASISGTTGTYDAAEKYTANATVVSLAAPTTDNGGLKTDKYGAATKIIVRVWLEGEDPDCWNDTAGQDWSINLKFNNETTAAGGGSDTDIAGVNTGTAPVPAPVSP